MKAWFLSRAPREKVLVLAFVAIGALIWLSGATKRLGENRRESRAAGSSLEAQQLWLDRGPVIEAASQQAIANLDAERTYDANRLIAEVLVLGQEAGLQISHGPARTQRTNQFAFHTVTATSPQSDLAALINFYGELLDRAPYLALEEISMAASRNAPGKVDVSMSISSVELVR